MTEAANIIAIASGKGGVGKTLLSCTLAHLAARKGQRVIVLDGDIGLANVDIQLGLTPVRDMGHWATGEAGLAEIVQQTPHGFDVIPGASGSAAMSGLGGAEIARLLAEFRQLANAYDLGLIDISAGVEARQIRLAGAAGRCLLTITEDPTSLTDGYAFVKMAQRLKRPPRFDVAVNMASDKAAGEKAYQSLAKACESFLKVRLNLLGVIRRDNAVAQAIRRQTPIMETAPGAKAAMDADELFGRLAWPPARAA